MSLPIRVRVMRLCYTTNKARWVFTITKSAEVIEEMQLTVVSYHSNTLHQCQWHNLDQSGTFSKLSQCLNRRYPIRSMSRPMIRPMIRSMSRPVIRVRSSELLFFMFAYRPIDWFALREWWPMGASVRLRLQSSACYVIGQVMCWHTYRQLMSA